MDAAKIIKKFNDLETDRKNLDGVLDIISRYMMPLRSEFFRDNTNEHMVDWRAREVFDSTAIEAIDTLSATMQGSLTSMANKWFELRMRDSKLNAEHEVQMWLEEVAKRMYQALEESNFDIEVSEFYLDLVGYGTSILVEEAVDGERWEGLKFKTSPIDSSYFEEDINGKIINFYQEIEMTPLQMLEKFGEENIPKCIKDKVEAGRNDRESVIFCVYHRFDKRDADTSTRLAAKARPYGYKYIVKKDKEVLGEEGGYYEMPAFVSRWRRAPGSVWGYSPSHIALSDVLTLNELTKDLLESLGKAVDPSNLTTQRNLLSDLDLGRGGLTIVRDVNDLIPYESRARFDVGELKIDRLQEAIRRAFRVDQLQLKDSPAMTATEANIRYEIMQRLLGPTLGRLKNDFLDPLLKRTFNVMHRAGQLPKVPEIVVQEEGEMDIEYIGPLPRAQRSQEALAVQQWIGGLAGIAEMFPEVMDIPDADMIARGTAELSGVPARMLKDKKKVDKERKQREAQQKQAMQQEQMQSIAGAAKDGAQAMKTVNEMGGV